MATEPDSRFEPRARRGAGRTFLLVVVVALVSAGAVRCSVRSDLSAMEAEIDASDKARLAAEEEVAATQDELVAVQSQFAVLQRENADLRKEAESATRKARQAERQANDTGRLSNGQHFGNFITVRGGPPTITVDLGKLYTGKAAQEQALADGSLLPGQELDKTYYISPFPGDPRTLEVKINAKVEVLTKAGSSTLKNIGWPRFVTLFNTPGEKTLYLRSGAYDFWLKKQVVTEIVQHDLPGKD